MTEDLGVFVFSNSLGCQIAKDVGEGESTSQGLRRPRGYGYSKSLMCGSRFWVGNINSEEWASTVDKHIKHPKHPTGQLDLIRLAVSGPGFIESLDL